MEIRADGGSSSSSATTGGGYLGVQVTPSSTGGVSIAGVMSGSPAATAGLQVGDTVVAVDEARVDTPDELVDVLAGHQGGDRVVLTWFSTDGQAHRATVTLAAR
jgi:S1-C subfamily serine protease